MPLSRRRSSFRRKLTMTTVMIYLFHGANVYVYDCDVPLAVIFDHLLSGGSHFAVGAEGGLLAVVMPRLRTLNRRSWRQNLQSRAVANAPLGRNNSFFGHGFSFFYVNLE
ncbi:hypothetical protein B0H14DRAFT_2685714 [Mycena olivaceomarginata]|nr:hypothetical protein B0H14DRAFT_2685714 [Mycena olivaceomarginata]